MDKNKIKSFAIWARRELIGKVSDKANAIGIFKDNIEEAIGVQGGFKLKGKEEIYPLSKNDRDALVAQVKEKGFEQVMEEVAYTWFNRFMGIRYMEVNDYLPTGIRVLSSEIEGKVEPDVLTKVSEVIEELELNANEIYELLDTGDTADREKAYRTILVKQCNELGKIIPQMFEKISDYTELLMPGNLLDEGSVIRKMVRDIEEDDWKQEVEIIGWMYQYYNTENNEKVYDGTLKKSRLKKELIPAATQIFTPDWVVKYMVENSLGRLWLEGHQNEELQKEFKYYLEEAEQEAEVQIELQKIRDEQVKLTPEDIKVLDPCVGSGHILVYAFDVLYKIYKVAGYSEREIPKLILKNNIYGLDIDDRAAQLATFALIMKARHYNRRLFREIEREGINLNLCSIQESNGISEEMIDYFCQNNQKALDSEQMRKDVEYLVQVFTDAKEYGSILKVEKINFENLKQRLEEIREDDNLMFGDYRKILLKKLPTLIKQGIIMNIKYEVCVTNPPYLSSSRMNDKLVQHVEDHFQEVKSDFSMIFYKKVIDDYCKIGSYISFITTTSWMVLKSFESIRKIVLENLEFESLVDFGTELFDGKVGHNPIVAWVNKKCTPIKKMAAIKLSEYCFSRRYEKKKEFFNKENRYIIDQKQFLKIPDIPIAYWLSNNFVNVFGRYQTVSNYASPRQGMSTCDVNRFVRIWNEVNINRTNIQKQKEHKNWIMYNKGGGFRKWYGNRENIVFWGENDGKELLLNGAALRNKHSYFKEFIAWTKLSSGGTGFRKFEENFLFDGAGGSLFIKDSSILEEYLLGTLNCKVVKSILEVISPTINYNENHIGNIPIIVNDIYLDMIERIVNSNISISKNDWDSFETSWDFEVHPLLLNSSDKFISKSFNSLENDWNNNFNQLKTNEEELNRIFIDIYGLSDELTPEVLDKDVTIRRANREREVRSFISYAVGCMLGRYSIDSDGLIYAGGEFNDKWNLAERKVRNIEKDDDGNIISDSWVDARFIPDADNIIPITEDEYFEDDMVSRFIEFVKTVYGEETFEENLDFIADSIGRKSSETSRQAIRRYFLKDFYKDHLKVYQKRPIYWMFESGKNNGFKCLVYMHRYDEQLVAKVRTEYLHTLQRKYEAEIEREQLICDSEEYTAKDRAVAKKKIDKISKQIEECKEYDQVVAYLANEKIAIDLDDGVKVNYAKFQNINVINSKDKEVKMNLLSKI